MQEQTTTGGAVVNAGGHVDLAASQFDRPGPTGQRYGEKTIVPVEMVATQLAVERPPVDDESYTPVSVPELSLAASEVAKTVPYDQVKFFYKKLKDLAEECIEMSENKDLNDRGEREMSESYRSAHKSKLIRMINEALDDMEKPRVGATGMRDEPGEIEPPEPATIEQEQEEFEKKFMKLDALASEFGFSGGPGARQWVVSIARRIKEFSNNVDEDSLAELQNMAVADYIDILETSGLIEAEDAEEMMDSYEDVMTLGSFRYFFVKAFVLPAFKIAEKSREDDIRDALSTLGVPRQVQDTIFYQLVGRTQKDRQAVAEKIDRFTREKFEVKNRKGDSTGQFDQLTPMRAQEMKRQISKVMPSLERRADRPVDYLAVAETHYDSLSDREKAEILLKSLELTGEDVEGVKTYKI